MQCPNCEKFIEDNSNHCPHCGAAVERTFCSECGQPIGGPKNQSGGLILLFVIIIGIMLVLFNNQQKTIYTPVKNQTEAEVQKQTIPQKPALQYEVLMKNSVSFEDLQTIESRISLKAEANKTLYLDSVKSIITEQRNLNPMNIVVVYAYEEGVYEENPQGYKLKATYVNTDLNTNFNTALLADQEKIAEHIYVKWQEIE